MAREDIERLADEDDGKLPPGRESTVDIGLPEQRQAIHIRLDPEVLRPAIRRASTRCCGRLSRRGSGRNGVDEERW
jgi:hypothetical protein